MTRTLAASTLSRMKRPNFFILGAPKCGTTSLAAWLGEHPTVYMSPVKEPFFFDTDETVIRRLSLAEYEALFACADDRHVAIGEASTTYLYSRVAVPNILAYLGRVPKFIVCVRNPIEMALSLHNHLVFLGIEAIDDFEKAWCHHGTDVEQVRAPLFTSQPGQICYGPRCKLGEQLERLHREAPQDSISTLLFDDMVQNPRQEYKKVLSFLGVADDQREVFPVYNQRRGTKSLTVARLMNLAASTQRYLRIRTGLGIVKLVRNWNGRARAKPRISAGMFNVLCDYFHSDVDKLGALLGRDLSYWLDPVRQMRHGIEVSANAPRL
jgi:Sulfotransferase domain